MKIPSGIVSAAVLDDENMSEIINVATDAFSSSLITVASKNKLNITDLANLTAVASEGVMSGSIEALSTNELPLNKLGAVMLRILLEMFEWKKWTLVKFNHQRSLELFQVYIKATVC